MPAEARSRRNHIYQPLHNHSQPTSAHLRPWRTLQGVLFPAWHRLSPEALRRVPISLNHPTTAALAALGSDAGAGAACGDWAGHRFCMPGFSACCSVFLRPGCCACGVSLHHMLQLCLPQLAARAHRGRAHLCCCRCRTAATTRPFNPGPRRLTQGREQACSGCQDTSTMRVCGLAGVAGMCRLHKRPGCRHGVCTSADPPTWPGARATHPPNTQKCILFFD